MKIRISSRRQAEILLSCVIIARATSYLFSKLILTGMGMFNLLGARFTLAFVLLFVLFFPRLKSMSRKTFAAGAVIWRFVEYSSILTMLLLIFAYSAIYLVCALTLAMNPEERNLIFTPLKKIYKRIRKV